MEDKIGEILFPKFVQSTLDNHIIIYYSGKIKDKVRNKISEMAKDKVR